MTASISTTELLVLIAAVAVLGVAVVIVGVAVKVGLGRKRAWPFRLLAVLTATALLGFALLGQDALREVAQVVLGVPDQSKVMNAEVAEAVAHAVTILRIGLAVLALAFLLVPGNWLDVAVVTLAMLVTAAAWSDVNDTRRTLKCGDPTEGSKAPCPTATPTPLDVPDDVLVAVRLPKAKVSVPVEAVGVGEVTVRAVVEERDEQGRVTRTVTRPYDVMLPKAVPADKLKADVVVYAKAAGHPDELLADVTTAKAIHVAPH